MNIIGVSNINDPGTEQGFTGKSLTFLQNANKEMFKGIIRSMIGEYLYGASATYGVSLAGCGTAGAGDTFLEGFLFFNGELFYTTGMTGLNSPPFTSPGNVPVFTLLITNTDPADPCPFSDGSTLNVHDIRRLTLTAGATGSGLFDYSRLIRYSKKDMTNTIIPIGGYTTSTNTTETITGATFTTPATSQRSYKISFVGCIYWQTVLTQTDGGVLRIHNSTTNTDVATDQAEITENTGGNNIPIFPITTVAILKNVAPNTTFILTITRILSANVTVGNGKMLIEEIPLA
ncbi:MAG TPA: hypothetical protein VN026_04625 [Bacteroidia bacterium]|jgi:hypothetical protein|nr:hypothetical protein [Bacteroidia bacterium]